MKKYSVEPILYEKLKKTQEESKVQSWHLF